MTYPSLGAHVNGWVNGTVPQIPGLNPGAGGPIHGQQVPNTQFPLNPATNPTPLVPDPVAAPLQAPEAPGAAPSVIPPTPIAEPTQLPNHQGHHGFNNFHDWAANNPNRVPIFNQLMQHQGFQPPVVNLNNMPQLPAGVHLPLPPNVHYNVG